MVRQPNLPAFPVPVAVHGINLVKSDEGLRPTEARELVNWLPDRGKLVPRKGYVSQSASMGSVQTGSIHYHEGSTGVVPIAMNDGKIWDISISTATEIHDGSFTSDFWVTETYNGYTFGVNGVDTPWRFDGSAHSTTGFSGTGLTLTDLSSITLVNNRLWLTENNSSDVWYGAVGAITGALTKFQLSQIAKGGFCQQIASWSRAGGEGVADYTVFIMSTGEILIYSGDPASTFSLVNRYHAPAPIGRRCWFHMNGEPVIITRGGIVPLTRILSGVGLDITDDEVWGKIVPAFLKDVRSFSGLDGWSGVFYENLVIVNVPIIEGSQSKQYVLVLDGSAWTTFDLPASQFATSQSNLIFSAVDGGAAWLYSGTSDNGNEITLIARQGNIIDPSGSNRRITMVRPNITANGNVRGIIDVDMDDENRSFSGEYKDFVVETIGGTTWGDSWGGEWAGGAQPTRKWYTVRGRGSAMSLISLIETQARDVSWSKTQVKSKRSGLR